MKWEKVYWRVKEERGGKVADYIPQLARVPADRFGVAICTIDGQQIYLGDALNPFTFQSSVKPLLYAAALEEHGDDLVHQHIGREPSGKSFNELALNSENRPHNPMINAGAIMSSSLLSSDKTMADRLDHFKTLIAQLSGDVAPGFDNTVFHSERETADRNFALAHYMREVNAFPADTDIFKTLDFYFSACSFETNARDMSVIGATLANGGVCPLTGDRVLQANTVKNCLSMMFSCGMYDYSGEFAFNVGLPAKSAVSGVILGVVPNTMAIAVWSPRLDACGNSVRGVEFFRALVEKYNFHNYDSLVESNKVDPRAAEPAGTSALYAAIHAASIGDIGHLRSLVARGHDLNRADYDGRTPLHLAASEGRLETVRFLINQGIAVTPSDRWHNTPLDDAIRHKQHGVVDLLGHTPGYDMLVPQVENAG